MRLPPLRNQVGFKKVATLGGMVRKPGNHVTRLPCQVRTITLWGKGIVSPISSSSLTRNWGTADYSARCVRGHIWNSFKEIRFKQLNS
jgi:hypothetical protein